MMTHKDANADPKARRTYEDVGGEAEAWFALIAGGEASGADRAAFAEWRLADPANARAYDEVEKLWRDLGQDFAALESDPGVSALVEEARGVFSKGAPDDAAVLPKQGQWLSWAAAVAALLIVAVGVVLSLTDFTVGDAPPTQFASAVGEVREVALDDGTIVTLDTASRVDVAYGRKGRRVALTAGRARFDVARDERRPFVVTAGAGSVTALGTSFDVLHTDGKVAVTLLEGAVSVEAGAGASAVLAPGERVAYAPDTDALTPVAVDLDVAGAWTGGRLVFKDATLAQAAAEINRYADKKISIVDPEIGAFRLRGAFKSNDPASFAAGVALLHPVAVEERDGGFLLSRDEGR